MKLQTSTHLAVTYFLALFYQLNVAAFPSLQVRRGGVVSTQSIAASEHTPEPRNSVIFGGDVVPSWWPDYIRSRDREIEPFVIEGRIHGRKLSKFKNYLRKMDSIRR